MSTVFTLKEIMDRQALGADARAFCEALLSQGEVLGVTLGYLPESVLWLVMTPWQARLIRDRQPEAIVLTLGEAADLATTLGDPFPTSLWQVAVLFSAPAPGAPAGPEPDADGEDGDGPFEWDGR
jgi:hypothetical protein